MIVIETIDLFLNIHKASLHKLGLGTAPIPLIERCSTCEAPDKSAGTWVEKAMVSCLDYLANSTKLDFLSRRTAILAEIKPRIAIRSWIFKYFLFYTFGLQLDLLYLVHHASSYFFVKIWAFDQSLQYYQRPCLNYQRFHFSWHALVEWEWGF